MFIFVIYLLYHTSVPLTFLTHLLGRNSYFYMKSHQSFLHLQTNPKNPVYTLQLTKKTFCLPSNCSEITAALQPQCGNEEAPIVYVPDSLQRKWPSSPIRERGPKCGDQQPTQLVYRCRVHYQRNTASNTCLLLKIWRQYKNTALPRLPSSRAAGIQELGH